MESNTLDFYCKQEQFVGRIKRNLQKLPALDVFDGDFAMLDDEQYIFGDQND